MTYNWTGFYIGGNVGGGWGDRDLNLAPNDPAAAGVFAFGGTPAPASFKFSHLLGGLQLGYNWQCSPKWLVGIETDFNWTDFKGSY
jgi:outer membrane immunogenic protein